jgi:hypothetical protein
MVAEREFQMKQFAFFCLAISTVTSAIGNEKLSSWRPATEAELREVIPARAPVGREHIETEFRTASAITDGKGEYVAGVGLITAGYAAEGKYSNFFITQVPLKVGNLALRPGEYVFGWRRQGDNALAVKFYEAASEKFMGTVRAQRTGRVGRIESFRILPPHERAAVQIGRFAMHYELTE